jgi:hypothetical protein
MSKINPFIIRKFLQDLATLTHQPELWRSHDPRVHVFLENATPQRRPIALVMAVELQPALPLLSTLEKEVADRYLAVGRQTWPPGMNSALKRQVSARIEALLATLNPAWVRPVRPLGEHALAPTTRQRGESRPARQIIQRLLQQGSARGNAFSCPR